MEGDCCGQLIEEFEWALPADQIKGLGEIKENHVERPALFSGRIIMLVDDLPALKPHWDSG